MTHDLSAMRAAAEKAQKVAPGPWEREAERQTDAPDRHYEFALFDGRGHRMCGTENSDSSFGEIHGEYDDEDGSYRAWNEPSQIIIDYAVAVQPTAVLALLDDIDALRAERDEALALQRKALDGMHDATVKTIHATTGATAAEASRDALAAEVARLREGLERLVNAKAISGVRDMVAGWNGENRADGPYERHRPGLGATLPKTNCGAVYELDEAMQSARALIDPTCKRSLQVEPLASTEKDNG